jgi:hypothetical protein
MTAMASARPTVVSPAQPAGPGAAAKQSWSARPKRAGEPRSGPPHAVDEAVPKPAPARLSEGYLAAARQTAAAAQAQTARIRAAQQERSAMPGPERGSPQRPAAPPAGAVQAHAPPVAGAAVVEVGRGLSVAEAARASPIAFRPLRQSSDLLLHHSDLNGAGSPGAPLAPASRVPEPAEPLPRVTPGRVEQQRRFAKTVAELERYQAAASHCEEPGASIVPRPALARPQQDDAAGSPWSRLWARRKDPAAE